MDKRVLNRAGSVVGFGGVAVCAASLLARAAGHYYIAGFEAGTLFVGGIAMIATACLLKLEVLAADNGQP